MLRAARHAQRRYPVTDTKRGRPGKWKREELLKVAARLGDILDRETSSHICVASFVDHYLRLLDFPNDDIEALASGEINLLEAEQLARITPERLQATSKKLFEKSYRLEPTQHQACHRNVNERLACVS